MMSKPELRAHLMSKLEAGWIAEGNGSMKTQLVDKSVSPFLYRVSGSALVIRAVASAVMDNESRVTLTAGAKLVRLMDSLNAATIVAVPPNVPTGKAPHDVQDPVLVAIPFDVYKAALRPDVEMRDEVVMHLYLEWLETSVRAVLKPAYKDVSHLVGEQAIARLVAGQSSSATPWTEWSHEQTALAVAAVATATHPTGSVHLGRDMQGKRFDKALWAQTGLSAFPNSLQHANAELSMTDVLVVDSRPGKRSTAKFIEVDRGGNDFQKGSTAIKRTVTQLFLRQRAAETLGWKVRFRHVYVGDAGRHESATKTAQSFGPGFARNFRCVSIEDVGKAFLRLGPGRPAVSPQF